MNIVLLVSSPNIPFRARKIVKSILGSKGEIHGGENISEIQTVVLKEILVRELPYHTLFTRKGAIEQKADSDTKSALYHLALRFDDQISRAKVTYVREFHTVRGMIRLRNAKPDLLIDLDRESVPIHPSVIGTSRLGLLRVSTHKRECQAVLTDTEGKKEILLQYSAEGENRERTLYLEAIALLSLR